MPELREYLGPDISKADIFDLEQDIEIDVTARFFESVVSGNLDLDELLTDSFVKELHKELYGDVWTWAGRYRRLQTNIGVAPELIAIELRTELDNLAYRWRHTSDLTPRQFGISVHAGVVRVHPFVDGNGRVSRLLGFLVFVATEETEIAYEYIWDVDRARYIALLKEFDQSRDATALAEFIPIRSTGIFISR